MSRQYRVGVVGVVHETNSFAPGSTHLQDFQKTSSDQFTERFKGTRTSMGGAIDAAEYQHAELVPGVYFDATPSGMVQKEAAETIMGALVESVPQDIDGLLVILHGAMVAEAYPDMEGEILSRLRTVTPVRVPIAVTLDLHANISSRMVENCDVIVGYDTYPHVDAYERAVEAFELLLGQIRGEINPVRVFARPNLLLAPEAMLTEKGPFQEIMALAFDYEKNPSVLNIVVAGGFPFSDIPDAGMSFVVITDNDPELAHRCAQVLCDRAWQIRESFAVRGLPAGEAVRGAEEFGEGPVILIEGSDNVGGGAPGDATHVLKCLVQSTQRSLAVICDPEAVRAACSAGVGSAFRHLVGGKRDRLHGDPVMVDGQVRMLFDGKYRHVGPYMTGKAADMGRTAVIAADSLTLVLTEKRTAPWDIGHIASLGLRADEFHIIAVKSAIAWKTSFGPFAKAEIQVDSPGCCSFNLHHFDYRHLSRPVYPLDSVEMKGAEI